MKHFTLLVLAALASLGATAENRTRQELLDIANGVLYNKLAASTVETRASSPLEMLYEGKELSVAGRKSGGFVVLANDDAFSPVLGYSSSTYTVGEENPAFKMWLEATAHAIETRAISTETHKPEGIPTEVASFITTKWSQSAPYNTLCPTYTENGATKYYPTGCVATAMAQAMYYFKYPECGTSKRTYRFDPGTGVEETVSIQLDTIKFDWDNMLDIYKKDQYSDVQAKAVAELMKACGASVDMQYTKSGSGAYPAQLNYALRRYFGYDKGLPFHLVGYETNEEFYSSLYQALADKEPVLYGGSSSKGGHRFVLDGYDAEGLVSVNWGWGGQQDGMFNITTLNGYSEGQNYTPLTNKGVYPEFQSKFVLQEGTVTFNQIDATHIQMITSDRPLNVATETYKGNFYMVAQNQKTGEATSIATVKPTSIPAFMIPFGYYAEGNFSKQYVTIVGKLDDGDYRLFLASKSDEETSYSPFRTLDGKENSYVMTIADGKITSLTMDGNAAWMVTGIEQIPAETQSKGSCKRYNINGQQVDDSYHGVVIKKGKKYVQ